MSKEREALKMALECVEAWDRGCDRDPYWRDIEAAVTAIRAALAEQREQQWNPNDHYNDGWRDGMLAAQQHDRVRELECVIADLKAECRELIAQQQERPSFAEWTSDYVRDNLHKLKPAQQEPVAITAEQAHEIGAKGAEPTEEERLLFEAWMRGHCWAVAGEWDGKTYKHEAETNGWPHPGAMLTRQLWAAWRDRAALTSPPASKPLTDEQIDECWYQSGGLSMRFARAIEAAHGIK